MCGVCVWCVCVVWVCSLLQLTASSSGSSLVLGCMELTSSPSRRDVTRGIRRTLRRKDEAAAVEEAGGATEEEEGVPGRSSLS